MLLRLKNLKMLIENFTLIKKVGEIFYRNKKCDSFVGTNSKYL